MSQLSYAEQIKIENETKLRKLCMELPDFCREFFRGIEPLTSSRTRIAYAYDLRIFFHFLQTEYGTIYQGSPKTWPISILDQVTLTQLEEYLDYLKLYENADHKVYSNDEKGRTRKAASIRTFFRYFYRKQKIQNNVASLLMVPKTHEHPIIRLERDEIAKLLDAVECGDQLTDSQKKYHNKTKTRDFAILTLLLGTGIRVSECVGLDIPDIDFEQGGMKIHRKGGNEVILYFGDEVSEALQSYMAEREQIYPKEGSEEAFFLSMQKSRISVRAVEKLVKKYAQTITTLKKITPHKLRSTYATRLYQETKDIYLVADVLGHSDVNTTKRHYAAMDDENRRSAARKVQLRENSSEESL